MGNPALASLTGNPLLRGGSSSARGGSGGSRGGSIVVGFFLTFSTLFFWKTWVVIVLQILPEGAPRPGIWKVGRHGGINTERSVHCSLPNGDTH